MVSPLISIHVLALVDPYYVPDESASHRVRPCAWPGVVLGQSGSAVRHQWIETTWNGRAGRSKSRGRSYANETAAVTRK